ncbi:MAG: glycoside hydrolase family 32 protein [Cyclobacteriaceae bacterium]
MKSLSIITLIAILTSCQTRETSRKASEPSDKKFRPVYHFTPPSQWMNDPNGMVYHDGEYHLFYQHYPDSNVWGPMHWGHAVSTDLVSWEHLPIALYPDELGYIFSGSAVIDHENTSGLGSSENPPMIAIYTYHEPIGAKNKEIDYQTQGIAYSLDKGRTWTKYQENPVIANPGIRDFRDPKVSWMPEFEKWVMILAVKDHVNIYSSADLKSWTKESEFGQEIGAHGGVWECPDLFKLTDQNGTEKWVMLVSINPGGPMGGSATQYFTGDFDGTTFTLSDDEIRWIDHGADNYAGVTWSNIPKEDGRRLFLGWMSNWQYANIVPTYEWRSAMTVPRELILRDTERGYEVHSKPVDELVKLEKQTVQPGSPEFKEQVYLLTLETEPGKDFECMISNDLNEQVTIAFENGIFSFDRSKSGITDFEEGFGVKHEVDFSDLYIEKVKVYVDKASMEIFINDGQRVMTEIIFPNEPLVKINTSGAIKNAEVILLQ